MNPRVPSGGGYNHKGSGMTPECFAASFKYTVRTSQETVARALVTSNTILSTTQRDNDGHCKLVIMLEKNHRSPEVLLTMCFMLVSCLASFFGPEDAATCSSDTAADFQRITRRYSPENRNLPSFILFPVRPASTSSLVTIRR
jgi:hypothetical protein